VYSIFKSEVEETHKKNLAFVALLNTFAGYIYQQTQTLIFFNVIISTYSKLRRNADHKMKYIQLNYYAVILDEKHKIKNNTAQAFNICKKMHCELSFLVTGTKI
jgi:SNF2 family DNA or RNA helicase